MAVGLKRTRGPVSYKEPSSDEDFSEASDHEEGPRKRRAVPQRRSTQHQSQERERISTRQSRQYPSTARTPPSNGPHTTKLRGRRKVSYKESTSDEDSGMASSVSETDLPQERQRRGAPRPSRLKKEKKDKRPSGRKTRNLGAPLKPNKPEVPTASRKLVSDGRIPAWATLPYHVLLQIFVYASHPLHDEDLAPTPSISWLARTARICTAFTKPALTALYRNPPIFALRQTRKTLVQHLISPPGVAHEDYAVMVKRLELDATRMSKLTDQQSSTNDLAALILSLKTLREIDIFDPYDKPPYRERSITSRRWDYPNELFTALRQSELHLRSWRWNSTYCSQGYLWMKEVHSSNAFQSLREIILTKFHPKLPKKSEEGEPTTEELLASSLAVLPSLKSLTFETCTVVNGRLLPLLPKNLVSLNITNCRDIISDTLQAFLVTHGSQLEELILDHNQSLDFSFSVDLKQNCPRLEVLRMDMHYYNTLFTSTDNEPLYDQLLPEGETPSWPSTLRIIDLEFLRQLDENAAKAFFTSLIDAAEELPWLREIVITAIVDINWRLRAEFRKNWTARFQKVFARRSSAPNPNLVSLRAFSKWKATHDGSVTEKNDSLVEGVVEEASKTMSTIVSEDESSDSDVPLLTTRKQRGTDMWDSKRLRSRAKSANYDETSDDGSGSNGDSEGDEVKFIQGMCHTVVFKVDNSRPQEQLYDEEDFLNAELSGDEDWNGNDVVDDGYAW